MYPAVKTKYTKVGQIFGLQKKGSWAVIDARTFLFLDHELGHGEGALKNFGQRFMPYI